MESGLDEHLLLATKLTVPSSYARIISHRSRLYAQLASSLQRPLTLVTAPTGFGKTTLISEWVRQCELSSAWLSLDKNDNDPERFWRYVLAALTCLYPRLADLFTSWPAALQSSELQNMLTTLINALLELPHDLVLVLDDYHTITSPIIADSFAFLLEHLPPHLHLIVTSRTEPPFPLARLRVQGKLAELWATDLRFTPAETAALFMETMKLALSKTDIEELHKRTEGWIAGLQLAAVSLQGRSDRVAIANFIHNFGGTNRIILSYLTEEVFAHLAVETEQFLLATSLLERMNASLCDAVTGQGNGQAMLEELDHSHLFLIALDDQQQWYRYYQFFAGLLQHRLKQKRPELVSQLHLRASMWYEQHSSVIEAIKHILAVEQSEWAIAMLERHLWSLIAQDECGLLVDWLGQVPASVFELHPALSFLSAWTLLLTGHPQEYEQALLRAERAWQSEQTPGLLGNIWDLRAHAALLSGDSRWVITCAQQALILAADEDRRLRGSALVKLGIGYLYCDEVSRADTTLLEGLQMSQQSADIVACMLAELASNKIQLLQGNLHSALQTCERMLNNTVLKRWYRAVIHLQLAQIYYEWNNIEEASEHWQQVIHHTKNSERAIYVLVEGYILAARLAWVRGEQEPGLAWLDLAEDMVQPVEKNPAILAQIALLRVQYLLEQGKLSLALHWYECNKPASLEGMPFSGREAWLLLDVRLQIAQGNAAAVIELLEELGQGAQKPDNAVVALILLTLAQHACGNTQQTMQALERALALAELHDYVRIFVDEGRAISLLLAEFYSRYQRRASSEQQGISLIYIYSLLAACGQEVQPPVWIVPQHNKNSVLDKLSEREQTVLSLIAEGRSNQDIAQKLVVTVSTIKTHLNNIYAKLHVHTRLQAVTTAYELGLLHRNSQENEADDLHKLHS